MADPGIITVINDDLAAIVKAAKQLEAV